VFSKPADLLQQFVAANHVAGRGVERVWNLRGARCHELRRFVGHAEQAFNAGAKGRIASAFAFEKRGAFSRGQGESCREQRFVSVGGIAHGAGRMSR
jgi:hypothetical protein